jgi:phospholipase C
MSTSDELERLRQIKHIVVLMMENRSFDQMLGYLKRAGLPDVEGLTGNERNLDAEGNEYPVFEFSADETAFHLPGRPLDKSLDPCHSPKCVSEQLSDGNGGFVKNYIAENDPPAEWRRLPMGYYTGEHLPIYDYLARQYCVCDAWHSSIPGDTWPNRLYAVAGRAAKPVVHKLRFLEHLIGSTIWKKLRNIPVYEVEAFTRQLEESQWRWYSHDPATLRAIDRRYRNFTDLNRSNFAYFDRKKVSLATQELEALIVGHDSFLDDAAKGELRDVSWIDPNFVDLSVLDPNSNDDHPPSDVLAGQELVLEVYDALSKSPGWQDTLLVIVYDEHGGFYDHVAPPPVDDGSGYPTYGVRVPAIVVGPRVRRFVSKERFDHTTLIKTILLRFAKDPETAIQQMGARVETAPHLGPVLDDAPRVDIPDHGDLLEEISYWRSDARARRRARHSPSDASDGAGQPLVLNDFQDEFLAFALAMRASGLPAGQT